MFISWDFIWKFEVRRIYNNNTLINNINYKIQWSGGEKRKVIMHIYDLQYSNCCHNTDELYRINYDRTPIRK